MSEASDALYAALEPAFTVGDEDRGYVVRAICEALVAGDVDLIHEIVTDSDLGEGWAILLDPNRCPVAALPYLAQFDGAILRPDMDEAQRRAAIISPEAFGRGTIGQIEAVTKRRLTGSQTVIITERYTGLAWRLRIETLESETPEPERTEQEIRVEAKPIGIRLFFNTRADWTWGEVRAEPAWDTWAEVIAGFGSWHDFRIYEP